MYSSHPDYPTDDEGMDDPQLVQLARVSYANVIAKCRAKVRSLRTVQFDPTTGIQRHFFNGKLERTIHVRSDKY